MGLARAAPGILVQFCSQRALADTLRGGNRLVICKLDKVLEVREVEGPWRLNGHRILPRDHRGPVPFLAQPCPPPGRGRGAG